MYMRPIPGDDDPSNVEGKCDRCNGTLYRFRGQGDIYCDCGAIYNSFGQQLRDDLLSRPNPSDWDEDIDDLTGYEIAMGNDN